MMSIHKWCSGLYVTVEDWYKKGYIYINVIKPLPESEPTKREGQKPKAQPNMVLSPEDPWTVWRNPERFLSKSVLLVDDEKGRKLIEYHLEGLANAIMWEMETEFSRERTTVIKAECVTFEDWYKEGEHSG